MKVLVLSSLVLCLGCGSAVVEPTNEPIDDFPVLEPTLEIPVIEAPIVDEPVVDTPVIDTPVVKEIVIQTPKDFYPYNEIDVKNHVLKVWGDDYEMVVYVIGNELEAWNNLKDYVFKDNIERKLYENAVKDWYPQYTMIEYEFNNQLEAYRIVGVSVDTCYNTWYPDFTMIDYCRNNN